MPWPYSWSYCSLFLLHSTNTFDTKAFMIRGSFLQSSHELFPGCIPKILGQVNHCYGHQCWWIHWTLHTTIQFEWIHFLEENLLEFGLALKMAQQIFCSSWILQNWRVGNSHELKVPLVSCFPWQAIELLLWRLKVNVTFTDFKVKTQQSFESYWFPVLDELRRRFCCLTAQLITGSFMARCTCQLINI